jgi:hypothetical protein
MPEFSLTQVHEPLTWRFPTSVITASTLIPTPEGMQILIMCDVIKLARFFFSVYLQMFAVEDQAQNFQEMKTANFNNQVNVNYTCASFVGLLVLVRAQVQTDWPRTINYFLDLVASDQTLWMGLHSYQDLVCKLHMHNLHWLEVLGA